MLRLSLAFFVVSALPVAAAEPVDVAYFEKHIRPLFVTHCNQCHDAKKAKGGLTLLSREAALAGGDTGPAFVPGSAEKSLLIQAVRYTDDLKMPPKGKLSAEEIARLTAWVEGGAPWPGGEASPAPLGNKGIDVQALAKSHWSFQPIRNPAIPEVKHPTWSESPLDRFLLAKLQAEGLTPAAPASPTALLRRLSFDLRGLPPEPEVVTAFTANPSPEAYASLVDRWLASPQFGERWARHWLDLVRYAETRGHEFDFEIPNAWRYRDYVIRAINADLPFDQFLREHIAGDLIEHPRWHPTDGTNESILGTGFWLLGEGKHSPVDIRVDQSDRMDNMIDVFGKTFLGLTISCARCHDHKFDPITAADYYALYGMLSSTRQQQAFLANPEQVQKDLQVLDDTRKALGTLTLPTQSDDLGDTPAAMKTWLANTRPLPAPLADWDRTGPAFPTRAELPHSGHLTEVTGGALRSPTWTIDSQFLAIRVAGKKAQVNVIIDNFHLIQNPIYGGLRTSVDHGEELKWIVFDIGRWKGHAAYLELLDEGPGYVALADARLSDSRPPVAAQGRVQPPPVLPTLPETATGEQRHQVQTLRDIEAHLARIPRAPAVLDGTGRNEHLFIRGNPKSLGEEVPRRFLEVFAGRDTPSPAQGSGRKELADALTSGHNPLVARVFVNRVWQHYFGVGLVPTPDDYGRQGQPPSHPELLDWLATDFMTHGWSVKRLHRQILFTQAYRMSSQAHPQSAAQAQQKDPNNTWLHRAHVRRLEAEAIRDAVLQVSGRLDATAGGPGVPPHLTEHMVGRGRPGQSGPLDGNGRRSIYLQVRRNFLNPMFVAFDYPTPFTTIGLRTSSNVPAQALVMLNNPFVLQEADRWATAIERQAPETASRLNRMYLQAFARKPRPEELAAAEAFLAEAGGDHAAWVDLAHALLNTKEFLFLE